MSLCMRFPTNMRKAKTDQPVHPHSLTSHHYALSRLIRSQSICRPSDTTAEYKTFKKTTYDFFEEITRVFVDFLELPKDLVDNLKPAYIGHEANTKKHVLTIKRPVEHTIITNWELMEVLWERLFQQVLDVQPDKQHILMIEPPSNPRANREKMTQIMFEGFNVPGLYLASTAELSLIASGRRTGVVLECGEGATFATPVYEGHCLRHCIPKVEICGSDLTYYMTKLLYEANKYSYNSYKDILEIPRDIKETLCYVAQDFEEETKRPLCYTEKIYDKPNNEGTISVGDERFRCPEAMFKPECCDNHDFGIHEAIYFSILKCDPDIRPELFSNIVISGGPSLFPGLSERLESEILKMAPAGTEVKVIAPANRKIGAWIGGSKLASSPNFKQMMMTKDEYDEFGPGLVSKKCF